MDDTKLMLRKGFTLIELLIVIAVLGILAVAVLAAINPIEQINRSRDTGSRSDAEQLIGGIDRFYATNGYYPWQTAPTDPEAVTWTQVTPAWTDGVEAVLDKLSAAGTEELKQSFTNRITDSGYNPLWVYNAGTAGSATYICFQAKSGAFQTEAEGRCANMPSDAPGEACPSATCAADKDCFSCLP